MGQAKFHLSNKWMKVWVVVFLVKVDPFMIWWQHLVKQLQNGPQYWERAVEYCWNTKRNRPPSDKMHNAAWIRWQWVGILWKISPSEIR
jgi:hypothetical protein